MLKLVAPLCGLALAGSVYMAGWGQNCLLSHGTTAGMEDPDCCTPISGAAAAQFTSLDMTGLVDVKNAKCAVSGHDPMGEGDIKMVYAGKVYHLCCAGCIEEFKKEPEKFVKLVEADPKKYGVPQPQ